jgi:hypothetical protein
MRWENSLGIFHLKFSVYSWMREKGRAALVQRRINTWSLSASLKDVYHHPSNVSAATSIQIVETPLLCLHIITCCILAQPCSLPLGLRLHALWPPSMERLSHLPQDLRSRSERTLYDEKMAFTSVSVKHGQALAPASVRSGSSHESKRGLLSRLADKLTCTSVKVVEDTSVTDLKESEKASGHDARTGKLLDGYNYNVDKIRDIEYPDLKGMLPCPYPTLPYPLTHSPTHQPQTAHISTTPAPNYPRAPCSRPSPPTSTPASTATRTRTPCLPATPRPASPPSASALWSSSMRTPRSSSWCSWQMRPRRSSLWARG